MIEWGYNEFAECGFDFDTDAFNKASDVDAIRRIMEPAYCRVAEMLRALPPVKEENYQLTRQAYLSKVVKQAAAVVEQNAWPEPAFVLLDLTGYRVGGKQREEYVQQIYSVANVHAMNFSGQCLTPKRDGDFLAFAFREPMSALRMAAWAQFVSGKYGYSVAMGIHQSEAITRGNEESSVSLAVDRANELREYENLPSYENLGDILVSSELVRSLETTWGLSKAYFEIVDKHGFGKEGLRGTEEDVCRLLYGKFVADNC
jgi:hypothetical protein